MTISLMTRTPGQYKVGIAGGPVIDWSLYEVMYTERYMDRPEENPMPAMPGGGDMGGMY